MKRWTKQILAWACIMFLSFSLSSCMAPVGGDYPNGKEENEANEIQIGFSFDSLVIERWERDRDVFASTAKEYGAEVNVQNANGDVQEQINQIEYLIEKKMDVIVIVCVDSNSLSQVVQKAKQQGIKVIAYDRMIYNANVDLYITFDNTSVGTLMGEGLVDAGITGGNVIMINGSQNDSNVASVEAGFKAVMNAHNVTIIDSIYCDGWHAEDGSEYVYNHLDTIANADAIMCGNDNVATKVVHALAENRLAGEILVVGQDADIEACQRIVEGTQVMTVYKPVEKLARLAAEYAIELAKGNDAASISEEKLPEGIELQSVSDGAFDVPYIGLSPIGVNKENIDEVIIDSGFHIRDEVYLNEDNQE